METTTTKQLSRSPPPTAMFTQRSTSSRFSRFHSRSHDEDRSSSSSSSFRACDDGNCDGTHDDTPLAFRPHLEKKRSGPLTRTPPFRRRPRRSLTAGINKRADRNELFCRCGGVDGRAARLFHDGWRFLVRLARRMERKCAYGELGRGVLRNQGGKKEDSSERRLFPQPRFACMGRAH